MAINIYPATSMNEYNLDWIIKKIKELNDSMTDYEALHTITFGGDWDISKQYTQWTIVSDPITHDGYLSLKPVPNNVEITNTEYWLKIADYTTGLALVNARIDSVEDDVEAIETDITDNIKPDIETIETDITDNIKPDIDDLEYRMNLLSSRRIIIFGDSYFMPTPIGGGNSVGYYLSGYLSDTNISFTINSQGGEGFAVSGSYNFLYDITNFVSPFNNDEVTDILFVGGYNDRNSSVSDIEDGMNTCFSACRIKYPNAKIHVGHFGWNSDVSSTERFKCLTYSLRAYRNACLHGASYMINSEYTMHYYDLFVSPSIDYIHPNSDGCREIAKQIALYLTSGSCDVHYPYKRCYYNYTGGGGTPYVPSPGGWTDTYYSVGSALDNDTVRIYMPDGTTYYKSPYSNFTISTSSYTALISLSNTVVGQRLHFMGMYDGAGQGHIQPNIPMKGLVGHSGDYNSVSQLECVLCEGSLFARNYSVNSANNDYKTITGVEWLELGGGMFTIPTLEC